MSRIMVRPSGRRKIFWDLLSVLVLGRAATTAYYYKLV